MSKFKLGETYKTRSGSIARVICVDSKILFPGADIDTYPIIALVSEPDGSETGEAYTSDGHLHAKRKSSSDLVHPSDELSPGDPCYFWDRHGDGNFTLGIYGGYGGKNPDRPYIQYVGKTETVAWRFARKLDPSEIKTPGI